VWLIDKEPLHGLGDTTGDTISGSSMLLDRPVLMEQANTDSGDKFYQTAALSVPLWHEPTF
jgi:hypothetical protein